MADVDAASDRERELLEEFALCGINAAVQFVKESNVEPSTMLAALGSMFWTYLMMISPTSSASANIDNAVKYMNHSAEEARSRIQEMDWAERMTHNEMGNA
jgi:spermidine/putrescine-binding protein